jgi:tripartite-type tricarboxylate transporter receptor subunit TctC
MIDFSNHGLKKTMTGTLENDMTHAPTKLGSLRRRSFVSGTALGAASLALPMLAQAQSSPIRIVVGYPPGGSSDRAARLVADRLQVKLGRTVVVENRVGAGGRLAAQQLVNTPADQTVMMIGNPAVMSVAPIIYKDLKFDPQTDFVPIGAATDYEFGVAVGGALPFKEVSHLMAWIRTNPDKANAGVPATGSLPHFFALMLSYMAQTKMEVVGYRGSAPLVTDLIGGQIPLAFDTLDSLLPQHQAGKLRILATSGAARSGF